MKGNNRIYWIIFGIIFFSVIIIINIMTGVWILSLIIIIFLIILYIIINFIKKKYPQSKIGKLIIKIIGWIREFLKELIFY